MAQKLRDLAVKTGTYTNAQGEEKGQWQNVGALMKGDDGNEFIIFKRWFNPAGLPNPDNRDSVIVSCFKDDKGGQGNAPQQQPQGQQPQGGPGPRGGQPAPEPQNHSDAGGYDEWGGRIPF